VLKCTADWDSTDNDRSRSWLTLAGGVGRYASSEKYDSGGPDKTLGQSSKDLWAVSCVCRSVLTLEKFRVSAVGMPAIHVRLRCLCQLGGQDQWRLRTAYVTFLTACGSVVACRLSGLLVSGTESRGLLEAYIPPQDGPGRTHATAAAAAAATAWQRCCSWGHPLRPTRIPLAFNNATWEILPLTIEHATRRTN
jgi:hypothetical protein